MITQAVKLSVKQSSREKHKRIQQEASAKLESYLYYYMLVCANTSCLPHVLLKATMYTPCALTSSSRSFYYVLGLWHHIMWPEMSHASLSSIKRKRNSKEKKYKIKKK